MKQKIEEYFFGDERWDGRRAKGRIVCVENERNPISEVESN